MMIRDKFQCVAIQTLWRHGTRKSQSASWRYVAQHVLICRGGRRADTAHVGHAVKCHKDVVVLTSDFT